MLLSLILAPTPYRHAQRSKTAPDRPSSHPLLYEGLNPSVQSHASISLRPVVRHPCTIASLTPSEVRTTRGVRARPAVTLLLELEPEVEHVDLVAQHGLSGTTDSVSISFRGLVC